MRRLLFLSMGVVLALAIPASADPGPGDEVEIVLGTCEDGTTILRAHNTQDVELGWLIRIDGRLVEQGRLAPDERVERSYEVELGESHFFRIRLGLPGDGFYFSTEGTTDRTDCPSETPPPSTTTPPPTTTTPPPTTTTPPPGGTSTSTPPPGGTSTSTPPGATSTSTGGPSVGGVSGTNTSAPGTAFTGSEDVPWLIAASIGFLLVGTLALRLASRSRVSARTDRS